MAKTQRYGIKFPFQILSEGNTLLDVNLSKAMKVKSEIMHVIFTPKGQRLRDPEFGTRLIQYLFEPSNTESYAAIMGEVKDAVAKYVPDCNIRNMDVYETDNGLGIIVKITYSVKEEDGSTNTYEVTTSL